MLYKVLHFVTHATNFISCFVFFFLIYGVIKFTFSTNETL